MAGSNEYQAGSGARVIRVNITGDGWLDPSTVRVVYTLVNTDTDSNKLLRVLSGPWSFFRRARCLVGSSAMTDDIDYYNRVHETFHILTSDNNRNNDEAEGFGRRWDNKDVYGSWNSELSGMPGNSARTGSFKPLFGILNQQKYIPLSWCPISMEFELVNNATDSVASSIVNGAFDFLNTSTSWKIQDVKVVCDVVTLDSVLQNSYAEIVLSGKSLPIN